MGVQNTILRFFEGLTHRQEYVVLGLETLVSPKLLFGDPTD